MSDVIGVGIVGVAVLALGMAARGGVGSRWTQPVTTALALGAVAAPDATVALGLVSLAAATQSVAAATWSRTAATSVGLTATLGVVAATAGPGDVALLASFAGLGLLAGVIPVHAGAASLAVAAPRALPGVLATLLAWTWVHLRHVDHVPLAATLAPGIVVVGSVVTLLPAIVALVATTVRSLFRATVVMHAGMLLMAVGAAGRGHYAAALFAAWTMSLALGGQALTVAALHARAGEVSLAALGGRVRAFPALAAFFALFGASGVGLPGTAGFIADDLLLHAVWEESAAATGALVLASALLAIATLRGFARAFLGPAQPTVAPDLDMRERVTLVVLLALLVGAGLAPQAVVAPVRAILGGDH